MRTWGWGLISFAAFLIVINPRGWQLILLLFVIGLIMVIRGKGAIKDGDSKNDSSSK
ncbi:MAG: hypothetical protein LBI13_08315 [Streptococcaceae bacterium]|jgi:hypothetical protein|nr:hypothetical protein [Streptococcaceae bacterium]